MKKSSEAMNLWSISNLLKKQVENLITGGKNKDEILEIFELNEEEWKKLQD